MFESGPVYHENINSEEDILINQGGTDSGKTYAIIQILFTHATKQKPPAVDPIITVVGESVPNLKKGAYRTAKAIYASSEALQRRVETWNETDRTIYFKSGWIIEFTSYESEQQAKQGKRQYSFFNEANGISWPIFWQVAKRTRRQVYVDYNPTAPFWVHEKLIGTSPASNDLSASVKLIISDHRHNPFLSEKDHERTEGIKDKDLWQVYARGKTGNLIGLIYTAWKEIPDEEYPKEDGAFWGIDFGYENDPTAIVKCIKVANSIYVHEIAYQSGNIPPKNIVQLMKTNGYTREPFYCEHDPDQIAQLRRLQIMAMPARKGVGSIKAGIQKVKEYKIFYTSSSVNIKEEARRYMWMIDPDTGKPTNEPKPGYDHILDAIRYAIYTHFYRVSE